MIFANILAKKITVCPIKMKNDKKKALNESLLLVPRAGVEPARIAPLVFETSASTDSAIWARREGDSNPRYGYPYDSLANCWFQPLTHLSVQLKLFLRSTEREKAAQRYDIYLYYAKLSPLKSDDYRQNSAICIVHLPPTRYSHS